MREFPQFLHSSPIRATFAQGDGRDQSLPVLGIRHGFVSSSSAFLFNYEDIAQIRNDLSLGLAPGLEYPVWHDSCATKSLFAARLSIAALRGLVVGQNLAALKQQHFGETRERLDEVLLAHHPRLFWHAFRILGNREDAEDALQDAFLSAARHFDKFEGRSKVSTWLTRVVINAALMVRRGKRSAHETSLEHLLSSEDPGSLEIVDDRRPGPEQACASSEIGALITEQFNQLSPALRSAFQLHHINGESCEEARRNLGITAYAMKSRVSRAKRRMASKLNHVRSEPGQSRLKKRREV